MSIGAAWGSGSWNGWAEGSWGASPSSGTWGIWSSQTATDMSRQFVTIGSIAQGDDVDFVLTADEAHPIYLSDEAQPFLLIQEVMEKP